MRKNAFASMCLFGSDNDSSISGIWIWRGQDLAFEVSASNSIAMKSPVLIICMYVCMYVCML
jgi:hypothetical protein